MSVAAPCLDARLPSDGELERALLEAVARSGQRAIAVVTVPAPAAPVDALALALRKGTSVVWRPPRGPAVGAQGVTARLEARGDARFEAIGEAARALFARVEGTALFSASALPVRLWGGWSFAPGGADREPWTGFGDACFVLPRWTYLRDGGHATLTLALDRAAGLGSEASLRAELRAVLGALAGSREPGRAPRVVRVDELSRERWQTQIAAITEAIEAGEVEKVVAARRSVLRTEADLDPWRVLRRLADRHPSSWCYGMRFGHGAFLAATPERLFMKRGRRLETDALAGSIGAAQPEAEARLRASDKDLREHRPVVAHLLEHLAPFCDALAEPGPPEVRTLPDVLHLHTPIRGRLRDGVDAARLVEALHPTPAVGGVPAHAARRWIDAAEAHPRGWYTGPVGWIDAAGDAELTVALRCGLVRGASTWLWAGGGIVRGSHPEAEWSESELKLRTLRAAIEEPA